MAQADPLWHEGEHPHVADEVIADIRDRKAHGVKTYGVALQALNGRRALQDLYEELLDGAHYVRQRLDEEDRTLRAITGDASVRSSLTAIYDRTEVIRKNPKRVNRDSLEQRYVDDLSYMRMVTEALLTELTLARQTPPEPPPAYEVAGYQYRVVGPDGSPGYDECYDRQHIENWCADPSIMCEGYYPEYRVLLAADGWYRVRPESPPPEPPGAHVVPPATEPPPGHGKAHERLPGQDTVEELLVQAGG